MGSYIAKLNCFSYFQDENNIAPKQNCLKLEDSGEAKQFMTLRERSQLLCNDQLNITSKLLFNPPFTTFSGFNDHLFITGYGGLTLEALVQHKIKVLVNVSEEIDFDIPSTPDSLTYVQFALQESYSFGVENYFDKVANKINELVELKQGNVVVFCAAGFSRSATMVLTYAIKYLNQSLKEAFEHLQQARPYARPNLIFMEKLIVFEKNYFGRASMRMEETPIQVNEDGAEEQVVNVKIPSIYKQEYPHLYTLEMNEARKSWLLLQCDKSDNPKNEFEGSLTQSRLLLLLHKHNQTKQNSPIVMDLSTNELKPFIVEQCDYKQFVQDVVRARLGQLSAKPSSEKRIASSKMKVKLDGKRSSSIKQLLSEVQPPKNRPAKRTKTKGAKLSKIVSKKTFKAKKIMSRGRIRSRETKDDRDCMTHGDTALSAPLETSAVSQNNTSAVCIPRRISKKRYSTDNSNINLVVTTKSAQSITKMI